MPDSLIGWASGSIVAPAPAPSAADSAIGWAAGAITAPGGPAYSDSPIGFAVGTIIGPPADLRNIYLWDGTTLRRGVMCHYDGNTVRTVNP